MAYFITGKVLSSEKVEATGMYKVRLDQGNQFSTVLFTNSFYAVGTQLALQVYIKAKQTPDKEKCFLSISEVPDRYKETPF